MTKFKQGDRVVPDCDNTVIEVLTIEHGQLVKQYWEGKGVEVGTYAFDCNKNDDNVHRYYGFVNGNFSNWQLSEIRSAEAKIIELPSSALRPASPKWEPKVGEEVEFRYKDDLKWFKGTYVGLAGIADGYCIKYIGDHYYQTNHIRPIAPSPEEEVGSILCKLIGGDNYILRDAKADIMAIFNRHKEGGANDND